MVVFTRLLESYPHSRPLIMNEAVTDICPMVRAEVWAAILGVKVKNSRWMQLEEIKHKLNSVQRLTILRQLTYSMLNKSFLSQ